MILRNKGSDLMDLPSLIKQLEEIIKSKKEDFIRQEKDLKTSQAEFNNLLHQMENIIRSYSPQMNESMDTILSNSNKGK